MVVVFFCTFCVCCTFVSVRVIDFVRLSASPGKKKTMRRATTRSQASTRFVFAGTKDNRLREIMGSRRRSWRRSDGEFRFREQVYESQSGLQAGDGDGGISEDFWDALQNTLNDTRDNEAVPFELDTMIQIMFHSPNGQVISTKMTPARNVKAHALCEEVLMRGVGSNVDLLVSEVHIKYVRPAQTAGGGSSNGATKLGAQSRLTVYSHGDDDKACGPRALVLLEAFKSKDESAEKLMHWNRLRQSHAKKTSSAAYQGRQSAAVDLCTAAGVDIKTETSLIDLDKLVVALRNRKGKSCTIQVFDAAKNYALIHCSESLLDADRANMEFYFLELTVNEDGSQHYNALKMVHKLLGGQVSYCGHCQKTFARLDRHNCVLNLSCTICCGSVDHYALFVTQRNNNRWKECPDCFRTFYGSKCFSNHKKKALKKKKTEALLLCDSDVEEEEDDEQEAKQKMPKPKRAKTSWDVFQACRIGPFRVSHPDLSHNDCRQEIGKLWKALSATDKLPYIDQARPDQERYRRELAVFNGSAEMKDDVVEYVEGLSACDSFWKCPKNKQWCKQCKKDYTNYNDIPQEHLALHTNMTKNQLLPGRCCEAKFLFTANSKSAKAVDPPGMMHDEPTKIHNCKENVWCESCKLWVGVAHLCYHKKKDPKDVSEKYLFCDFECIVGPWIGGIHKVNLSVTYDYQGSRVGTHKTINELVEWLMRDDNYNGYTVIFHNGRGYDFQFIVQSLLEGNVAGSKLSVTPVMNGSSIMTMKVTRGKKAKDKNSVRFVDSLNFLTMPLKEFTKTFGLQTKKGFYSLFFNTAQNEKYRGAIPEKHTFGYKSMDAKTRKEFDDWYPKRAECMSDEETTSYFAWLDKNEVARPADVPVWDNEYELDAYCDADVRLLREGCLAFRQVILELTDGQHDPFSCATIASSAKTVFNTRHLKENVIGAFTVELNKNIKRANAGGRTGPTKLYYKAQAEEKIHYVDMTSLYPFINAYGRYPVEHPVVYVPVWPDIHNKITSMQNLAVIECDVDCPQDLYHPLLHYHCPVTDRLMFDLRPKRKVSYTSLELQKAISIGYTILKVYNVIEWYEEVQGIFKDYVFDFLKLKQEAAGWPWKDMTEAEKDEYMQDYFDNQGIKLNPEKISDEKNAGLYATAKFYLNSLWGKFGQRFEEDMSRTSILFCDVPEDQLKLNAMQTSGRMTDVSIVNERCVIVNSRPKPRSQEKKLCYQRNMALGVFTTSQARLKLYERLEALGDRVLYYDTDSIIYVARAGEDPNDLVQLGKYLGDWTNELGPKDHSYDDVWIVDFVSGGPKCYGYSLNTGKNKIKIKGFSTTRLNVAEVLNYETMMRIMTGEKKEALTLEMRAIRKTQPYTVANTHVTRTFRDCYIKRQKLDRVYNDAGELHMIDTKPWNEQSERALYKKLGKKLPRLRDVEEKNERPKRQKTTAYSNYLLQSISDPTKFYNGCTTDAARRLREHNGDLNGGAEYTKLNRPWRQLAVLQGFRGRSEACQYETTVTVCNPALLEQLQRTEQLRWLRKFLWPSITRELRLQIVDASLEQAAQTFMKGNVTLCLQRNV
jgi:predicted GIY-YIG superfamily endonuclease